jgi:hypothetical protein
MLIAALVLFLTGGSAGTLALTEWLDHGADYAKKEIADPVKRRDLLAVMDEMKDRHEVLRKAEEKATREIHKLAERRESRAADFQPALSAYRAEIEPLQTELLDLRFKLASQLTREQWAAAHRKGPL